jgi:hypothetical protein
MTMRIRSWMQCARPAGLVLAAVALSVLASGTAVAQRRGDLRGDVIIDAAGAPGGNFNVSQAERQRGFRLFAGADGAGAGMHMSGNFDYALDNYSPCDNPISGFCAWNVRAARGGGTETFQFFEVLFAAAAPPTDWALARKKVPSLSNVKGGGFTYLTNFGLFSGRYEWGPRDGTLSKLFSGVTTVADGSCRDQSGFGNGYFTDYASGAPLLAASNCPVTWPGGVWLGDREVSQDGYKEIFDQDPDTFQFNYWQVPDSLKKSGQFMGTNFSTYGETSDHFKEVLSSYGSVIPGGSGDPSVDGYPMGLIWHFDAFNFGVPSLASVTFLRATVINASEEVYGVGIDYDSLYLGFQPGTGGSTGGGGQRFSDFYIPSISTALYHQSYITAGGPCTQASRSPSGVSTCASGPFPGMSNGGNAIVVLKSPIGDLRNKLLSNPTSPFYAPGNPAAGDTITFNHGHICGYGSCWATVQNVNDKRSFGLISSNNAITLDGRDPSSLTNGEAWLTFRTKLFPTQRGKFNTYVPGVQGPPAATWDYNHDGSPDTLYYDTCADQGCVVSSSDTMPGGQINAYGNVGGILAAGPFRLAAGDSTSWYVALVGDADSARTWASINAAIDLYMNFFLSPEPPPPVTIASTQLTPGTTGEVATNPEVKFFFSDAPEKWVDQFLLKLSEDVRTNPTYATLRANNPGIADSIEERASDNLEAIEIYKSCDGGSTWTGNADCVGDPTTDVNGLASGLGWRAYAIYNVDAYGGDVPNVFTDRSVTPGLHYVYTVVGKSRGAEFNVIGDDGRPTIISFAPSIRNTLSRASSDPNVLSVYVPASRPAGYQAAQVSYSQEGGATVPFAIDISDRPTPGNYQVAFGNRITVERDSIVANDACGDAGSVCGTRVILARVVNAAPGGTPTVVRADTLFRSGADVFPVAGSPDNSATSTVGNFRRTQDRYDALGFVAAAGSTPIFASVTLTGDAATPTGVFALADYPGFTVSANNTQATQFNNADEQAFRGATTIAQLGLPDTSVTIPRGDVNRFMAQWREQSSQRVGFGLGRYVVHWKGDAFGLPKGLSSMDANSEAELTAALQSRPVATTGLTDAGTAALLDAALTNPTSVAQQDLEAVKLPFTVRNTTFGRDVSVAMLHRTLTQALSVANTYRLGSNADTMRVRIPEVEWVPGDLLYFIENVTRDSTVGSNVVLDGSGQPISVTNPQVTFTSAVIGCDQPLPPFCNPLGINIKGSTGWLATNDGDSAQFDYLLNFSPGDRWVFDLTPPVSGEEITQVTDSSLAAVRVVPNPFIVYSQYQTSIGDSRILFTNVPPTGTLRVYTISGQFVQQITWTPSDLSGTGDLAWNLKSRENIDIASGLYIWTITAPSDPTNASSATLTARGKFVVIRGQPR